MLTCPICEEQVSEKDCLKVVVYNNEGVIRDEIKACKACLKAPLQNELGLYVGV